MDSLTPTEKFEQNLVNNGEGPKDPPPLDKVEKEASKASTSSTNGRKIPKKDGKDAKDAKKQALSKDPTTSQLLMEIIEEWHFFKDKSGTGWAKIDGCCYKVGSTSFKRHLQRKYYLKHGKPPYSQAISDVKDQAEMIALFESDVEDVNVRVAKTRDTIVIDRIGSGTTIQPNRWENVPRPDVNFWQPKGMNALPKPTDSTGGIDKLRKYLNFDSEEDFQLMIGWLLTAYNPEIPCPALNFQGEQGTAKSTNSKVLRSLIDPSGALINSAPREEKELIIQAQNSRVICLDNLSGLKKWLSDALCRVCTGAGLRTRQLYMDEEEKIFKVKRPIILNGIDDIATRGDLLDRSIVLNLPTIDPENRIDERQFWKAFNQDQPSILAALYDGIAAGLAADKPNLKELPRMADFAEWISRCEDGLPWENGALLRAYNENQENAIESGLDGDYFAIAIRNILKDTNHYQATPTDFVRKVRDVSDESSHKYLPTTRTLKSNLTRLAPALREIGIGWDYDPHGNQRTYTLSKDDKEPSTSSQNLPF